MDHTSVSQRIPRAFVRVPLRFVVDYREYRPRFQGPAVSNSETRDISGNGVLLETHRPIEVGVILEISMRIPGWHRFRGNSLKPDWTSIPESLILVGTVVRCSKNPSGESYEVGLVFTHMDPDDRSALLNYLESAQDNPK